MEFKNEIEERVTFEDRLLSTRDVCEIFGGSSSKWLSDLRTRFPDFPKPSIFSSATRFLWRASEVQDFLARHPEHTDNEGALN